MNDFFFHTRDEILKTLEKDKKYQECRSDSERIARQFPIIGELLEGRKKGTTVELTERERAAAPSINNVLGNPAGDSQLSGRVLI